MRGWTAALKAALLLALRAVGYTDFVWRWRRGGSLLMWARRNAGAGGD